MIVIKQNYSGPNGSLSRECLTSSTRLIKVVYQGGLAKYENTIVLR